MPLVSPLQMAKHFFLTIVLAHIIKKKQKFSRRVCNGDIFTGALQNSAAKLQNKYTIQRHEANAKIMRIKSNNYFLIFLCVRQADIRRRADDSLWFPGVFVSEDSYCQKNKELTCNIIAPGIELGLLESSATRAQRAPHQESQR